MKIDKPFELNKFKKLLTNIKKRYDHQKGPNVLIFYFTDNTVNTIPINFNESDNTNAKKLYDIYKIDPTIKFVGDEGILY